MTATDKIVPTRRLKAAHRKQMEDPRAPRLSLRAFARQAADDKTDTNDLGFGSYARAWFQNKTGRVQREAAAKARKNHQLTRAAVGRRSGSAPKGKKASQKKNKGGQQGNDKE